MVDATSIFAIPATIRIKDYLETGLKTEGFYYSGAQAQYGVLKAGLGSSLMANTIADKMRTAAAEPLCRSASFKLATPRHATFSSLVTFIFLRVCILHTKSLFNPFLPQTARQASNIDEKRRFASIGGSVRPMTLCDQPCASTESRSQSAKIGIINVVFLRTLSEIKLKRTDTTLDLSHNGKESWRRKEKGLKVGRGTMLLYPSDGKQSGASIAEFYLLILIGQVKNDYVVPFRPGRAEFIPYTTSISGVQQTEQLTIYISLCGVC